MINRKKGLKQKGPAPIRLIVYYWENPESERRFGWFHESEEEALKWLGKQFWHYYYTPILEDYLKDKPKTLWERERRKWLTHKKKFEKYVLKKAEVWYG